MLVTGAALWPHLCLGSLQVLLQQQTLMLLLQELLLLLLMLLLLLLRQPESQLRHRLLPPCFLLPLGSLHSTQRLRRRLGLTSKYSLVHDHLRYSKYLVEAQQWECLL